MKPGERPPGASGTSRTGERAAVLRAWPDKPPDLRREALDRLLDRITLSDGGAHVDHAVKDEGRGP